MELFSSVPEGILIFGECLLLFITLPQLVWRNSFKSGVCFQILPCCSTQGWWWQSAFGTKWVAGSSEREEESWEAREKQGIIICFSHCCPSFYAYVDICWENEHSLKAASFGGNVPKQQMAMDMGTVTQRSCLEFRGVCVKMANLIENASPFLLLISCSSSESSHSPPHSASSPWGIWRGLWGSEHSFGCEDKHLEPRCSSGMAWTSSETRSTSGFASCPMKCGAQAATVGSDSLCWIILCSRNDWIWHSVP